MAAVTRRELLVCGLGLLVLRRQAAAVQPFQEQELAAYRLTAPVFKRFAHATRLIAKVISSDRRYLAHPLITRDIWVSGEASAMANALQERLEAEPPLTAALFAADISAREYAAFAIALFGAHLAHGFVASGAIRRVPAGVAADNVAFVEAHASEIAAVLKQLNLD